MEENLQHSDVASGTFVGRWPHWLRWVLFLPTAVVGAVAASILYLFFNQLSGFFFGWDVSKGFLFQLVSTAILAGVFVYAGAWMAPKYQFVISIFLLILLVIVTTLSFLLSFSSSSSVGPINYGIHALVALIAGGGIVLYLKNSTS